MGYINGGVEQVVSWLESDPTTPAERKQAKVIKDKIESITHTANIVAPNVRGYCSSNNRDGTVAQAINKLFVQAVK